MPLQQAPVTFWTIVLAVVVGELAVTLVKWAVALVVMSASP